MKNTTMDSSNKSHNIFLTVVIKLLKIVQSPEPFRFHCSQTLALHNKLYRWMNLEPMIIKWDSSAESFTRPKSSKLNPVYWLWYFNIFIVAGLIGFGSCIWVVVDAKNNGNVAIMAAVGFGVLSILDWGGAAVVISEVDEIVDGFKAMKRLRGKLDRDVIEKTWANNYPYFHKPSFWYKVSVGFQLSTFTQAILPPIIVPFAILLKLDPFIYTLPKIFPADDLQKSSHLQILLIAMRSIGSLICSVETSRFYSIIFPLGSYWLELHQTTLETLNQIPQGKRNDVSFFKWYSSFQVNVQMIKKPIDLIFGLLMATGFSVFVAFNIGTIRGFDTLPMIVYWFLPTISLLCIFFAMMMLPLFIELYEQSFQIITRRIKECQLIFAQGKAASREQRYIVKRYDSIKPLSLSCADLFPLKKGSDVDFFYLAIGRTVDGMLLPFFN